MHTAFLLTRGDEIKIDGELRQGKNHYRGNEF